MSTATADAQPIGEAFNPVDPGYLRDPQPVLARARAEQPVFYSPMLNMWVVTRYDDLLAVTRDWRTFSQSAIRLIRVPPALRDRVTETWFDEAFMNADPPIHTIARKVVNSGFTRPRIAAAEPQIREIAHSLIDGFAADGHCEFMGQYAYAMGATTLATFVGLPVEDMTRLKAWAQDLLVLAYPRGAAVDEDGNVAGKPMDEDELTERWTRMADCREYLHALVEDRRVNPTDDLISVLVHATDDAGAPALATERIVTHLIDLIAAGTDTVAPLMAHALRFLLENPDQLAAVTADPSLLENTVEETLRMRGTGNLLFRYTTSAVELGGVTIPADAVVGLSYASGGYDESQFRCPHDFDVRRENADDHLAFGRGRHFCIGAPLARLEARVSLQALIERLPGLRVTPGQELDYHQAVGVFMLKAIAFEWDADRATEVQDVR
jgi:cytochrome P450